MKNIINIIAYNKRITPYKLRSNDNINIGANITNALRCPHYYFPIQLWSTQDGGWNVVSEVTTDIYGKYNFLMPCVEIDNITCCLFKVTTTFYGTEFTSNTVRVNFVENSEPIVFNNEIITIPDEIEVFENAYIYF